jgi:hypothetical protein
MILVGGTARIDEGNAMKDVETRMMSLAKDDTVHMLSKHVFWLPRIRGELIYRTDVVSYADLEAFQVLNTSVGKIGQIQLKIVTAHGQNLPGPTAQTGEHSLALQVAGVYNHVGPVKQV